MTNAASPIPTQQEYTDAGGKPEDYPKHVQEMKLKLEKDAMEKARSQSKRVLRVRVKPGGWRPDQTNYKVPAKAPHDTRLRPGDEGYEHPYVHEPALSLPIGKVSEVPIRDDRHLLILRHDTNLELVDDEVPTHQEERAVVDAALAGIRAGGIPGQGAVSQKELDGLKAGHVGLQKELAEVKDWADRALGAAREDLDGLQKQVDSLTAQLSASEKTLGETKVELEKARADVVRVRTEHEAALAAAREAVEAVKREAAKAAPVTPPAEVQTKKEPEPPAQAQLPVQGGSQRSGRR